MLDFVRAKQKSVVIKVAFGLIILSFVIGYTMLSAPSDQSSNQQNDVAARVNGEEISYSSYQSAYSGLYNLYQSIYQGSFNATLEQRLNLPRQAMQQLIEEALLVQQASKLGLKVSNQELIDNIAQYDAFQVDGQFNRDRYLEVLSYQRIDAQEFENSQTRALLSRKVQDALLKDISLSDEELAAAFHERGDSINLNFVWITPALVENKVEVSDTGLNDFFNANKEDFRIPEKVALRYLQFDPARYEDEVTTFDDEDIDRYYRRNLDRFEIKEQVKAAHILLSVAADATETTVAKRKALAEKLLTQLQDGADFTSLAKAHSDDKSNAANGGALGTFGRDAMPQAFEDAAFALRPGQLSDVVQTQLGFHIIKVEEYIEPGVQSLADVIGKVKDGLKQEKSRQLAYEKAIDAYNINRKSGDLDAAAKANDLGVKETGLFAANAAIDGIGRVEQINQSAFTLKSGELARPIQTTQGVFLFALKERQENRLPELSEVRVAVEQAYRSEQAQLLSQDLANELLSQAVEQNNLATAAKQLKLNLEETGAFTRSYGSFVPRIGDAAELAAAAFNLSAEKPVSEMVFSINGRSLIAALKEFKIADFSALDEGEKEQLQTQVLQQKKDLTVSTKLDDLMQQAEIEIIIPDLIAAFNEEA
jgi:peptidyl-prolyl cis-trans isomerase D